MSGRQRTRGFVLLPVVLLLALLAVIGYLYNQAGALQGHLLSDGEDMDQARYVAEAGLNHALARTRPSSLPTAYCSRPAPAWPAAGPIPTSPTNRSARRTTRPPWP